MLQSSRLQELAEIVRLELMDAASRGAFRYAFNAPRYIGGDFHPLEGDADCVNVQVLGHKTRRTLETRGGIQEVDYSVAVVLQKKMASPFEGQEFDSLSLMAEQVSDYFFTHQLDAGNEALVEVDTDEMGELDWQAQKMRNEGLFFTMITLTFRGCR